MSSYNLKYSTLGARAILIEWPSKIDENILKDILNFKNSLENRYIKQEVQIINTYNSLLINYNFTIDKIYNEICLLKDLYSESQSPQIASSILWKLPVCYHENFGIDLNVFSKEKSLTLSEIIHTHSDSIYTVFFIGFLPGFLYLGGLDKRLHFDRKSTPNMNIKKGSVAIGGEQTGIYPQASPGGWHIIGNSPINFFDLQSVDPCFAKPGDKIEFKPISLEEHGYILELVKLGNYQLESEVYDG